MTATKPKKKTTKKKTSKRKTAGKKTPKAKDDRGSNRELALVEFAPPKTVVIRTAEGHRFRAAILKLEPGGAWVQPMEITSALEAESVANVVAIGAVTPHNVEIVALKPAGVTKVTPTLERHALVRLTFVPEEGPHLLIDAVIAEFNAGAILLEPSDSEDEVVQKILADWAAGKRPPPPLPRGDSDGAGIDLTTEPELIVEEETVDLPEIEKM